MTLPTKGFAGYCVFGLCCIEAFHTCNYEYELSYNLYGFTLFTTIQGFWWTFNTGNVELI